MIVWINGAFGVGKTHTVMELHRRFPEAFFFDPENVGYFLRKHLPKAGQPDDFQHLPLWRKWVRELLKETDTHVPLTFVPMTIVETDIYNDVLNGLRHEGVQLLDFTLMASRATIRRRLRLRLRGDRNDWTYKQVDRCMDFLQEHKPGFLLDTERLSLDEVVETIAAEAGLVLQRPRLKGWQRRLRWGLVTLRSYRLPL